MARGLRIFLDVSKLDRVSRAVPGLAAAVLDKIAFQIEGAAKAAAPVDTGALRSSIYVAGSSRGQGTGYDSAVSDAVGRRPGVGIHEVENPPDNKYRVIGVAVEYAIWQEFRQPYLMPAVEAAAADWGDAFREVIE